MLPDNWDDLETDTGLIPSRARDIIREKHAQYKEAMARVRELEAQLARTEADRDNWREMFMLRVRLTDLALEAVLQQDRRNQELRQELFFAEHPKAREARDKSVTS